MEDKMSDKYVDILTTHRLKLDANDAAKYLEDVGQFQTVQGILKECSVLAESYLAAIDKIHYLEEERNLLIISAYEVAARNNEEQFRKGVNPEKFPDYVRTLDPEKALENLECVSREYKN